MAERTLKVYRQPGREIEYPEIRLSGKWLQDSGFEIGDYIRVAYDSAKITIKKIGGINET